MGALLLLGQMEEAGVVRRAQLGAEDNFISGLLEARSKSVATAFRAQMKFRSLPRVCSLFIHLFDHVYRVPTLCQALYWVLGPAQFAFWWGDRPLDPMKMAGLGAHGAWQKGRELCGFIDSCLSRGQALEPNERTFWSGV